MTHMVELAHYYDVEEAHVVRGVLDSNNIMTTLMGEHHLSVEPYLRIGLGGYRILVPSGQLSEAIKLLNGTLNITIEPEHRKIPFHRRTNWLWLPIVFLSGGGFIPKAGRPAVFLLQLLVLSAFYLAFFVL